MPAEPSSPATASRDQLASLYFEQLPYPPYPVQEEALLAYFTSDEGVLVCAPTGTGKTLIAEAALFEALHTGRAAYYTTPLIALTEQKFSELQAAAERWGFSRRDVGLVTGHRRVNPEAKVLVVVAEILLNRLLHPAAFDFQDVSAVVMDEFHSFNDLERGVVWELSLALLPPKVRLLLLSATVGNSLEFVNWLSRCHGRRLELVHSTDRKVPLDFRWVGDELLTDHIEAMAAGDEQTRYTPTLIFCFNRDECWSVADQLKGRRVLSDGQQARLVAELDKHDWSQGAGPRLKQLLIRGVGVHHAGVLPKYRRLVESLFQKKLLTICVCTETLSAGINLPARSVVLPTILKGPPDKKKLMEASGAHQIFGRAGRPQFDTQGFVFALAHEDDVKLLRWREKYDQIPEDTKDPQLRIAKKNLKKKMPKRRVGEAYWSEQQFEQLRQAPPAKLSSKGHLPWRLLAYLLKLTPEVEEIRALARKRLMDNKRLEQEQQQLDRMLLALSGGGFVTLDPPPPANEPPPPADATPTAADAQGAPPAKPRAPVKLKSWLGEIAVDFDDDESPRIETAAPEPPPAPGYRPVLAHPTPRLDQLLAIRSTNPVYGVFLVDQLGEADRAERIQALESVLEMPGTVARLCRVPKFEELPPGKLAVERLDEQLLSLGLATAEELRPQPRDEEESPRRRGPFEEPPPRILNFAEKLRLLFQYEQPGVHDLRMMPVWAAGELLEFGGDFNKYITARGLQKQEGVIFRHLLRMILLVNELVQLDPPSGSIDAWCDELYDISDRLTACCRVVDPHSTDDALEQARAVVAGDEGEPEHRVRLAPAVVARAGGQESPPASE